MYTPIKYIQTFSTFASGFSFSLGRSLVSLDNPNAASLFIPVTSQTINLASCEPVNSLPSTIYSIVGDIQK